MSDIVEQLKQAVSNEVMYAEDYRPPFGLLAESLDEITRLRAIVEARKYLMQRMGDIANDACEYESEPYDLIADLGYCGDPIKTAAAEKAKEQGNV